jgi:RimJ/RimL family protein N-acetyltransferase
MLRHRATGSSLLGRWSAVDLRGPSDAAQLLGSYSARVAETAGIVVLREMTAEDVPHVLDVQQPGAILGLAEVFPQDRFPFPREVIARRWLEEIATPGIDCLVVLRAGVLVGFAAARDAELLHFGIAVEHWGTGVARDAHDAVLDRMRARGVERASLRVFTENRRGRRFYEKLGWVQSGASSHSAFPPFAELLRYECDVAPSNLRS